MSRATPRHLRQVQLALVATFLATLLLVLVVGGRTARAQQTEPSVTVRAVYLIGATAPALDTRRVRAAGVRVVTSMGALAEAATTADAIVIDAAAFPQVSASWLSEQYRQGKVIAGINIPILELADRANYQGRSGLGGYRTYYGRPYFSMFYDVILSNGGSRGGTSSDYIYSMDGFLWLLHLETDGATVPPPPPATTPGIVRPRP